MASKRNAILRGLGARVGLLAALGVACPEAAFAAPKAAVAKVDVDRLKRALESGNEADKLAALDEISRGAPAAAPVTAPLVAELLARGATVPVLDKALAVAGQLAQPSTSAAVTPYVRHRVPELRRGAARALSLTGGAEAAKVLRSALRSGDREVRGAAAEGLAKLGVKEAVPDLFEVLGKDVPEAAAAIGQLCAPDACTRLANLLGKLPFDTMQRGFERILLRPEQDVPEETKLDLLERLRKLQTKEARAFLQTVRARYPAGGSARIIAALEAAVENRPVLERGKP